MPGTSPFRTVVRFSAVASSLCLLAGFVAYRTTAAREARGEPETATAGPLPKPTFVNGSTTKSALIARPEEVDTEPVLFSGSKSGRIVPGTPPSQPTNASPVRRRLIGGSKSAEIVPSLPREAARRPMFTSSKSGEIIPSQPVTPVNTARDDRPMFSGSKVMIIEWKGNAPQPFTGDLDPVLEIEDDSLPFWYFSFWQQLPPEPWQKWSGWGGSAARVQVPQEKKPSTGAGGTQ